MGWDMIESDEADLRRLIIKDWLLNARPDGFFPACQGKEKFAASGQVMQSSIYRKSIIHGAAMPYRCHYCGHWHIGNSVQRHGKKKPMRIYRRAA